MASFPLDVEKIAAKVVESADALVVYCDVSGILIFSNRRFEEFSGRKKEDLSGLSWPQVFFGENNTAVKSQTFKVVVDNAVKFKRPALFEAEILDKDGSERVLFWNITPILSDLSEPEGILFIGNDVTDLRDKEASFKKIDETIKNIFSSISEYSLIVTNLEGNITYFAMGSESMFGWQKNEIIFKHVSTLFAARDAQEKLPLMLTQVKALGRHEEDDVTFQRKTGDVFPVILTVAQFNDSEFKHTGYIFIAKDITERKKLEYQIFQAEKLAALGHLVAGMAHEINNPLFVISGRLEMLLAQKRLSQKVRSDLTIISEQAERIRKLVNRLLMFARQSHMKLEVMDVNHAVESVLPFLSYQKSIESHISIQKNLAPDLRPIKGDLNQLQEVFVNLCINACHAMSKGGTLKLTTSNLPGNFIEVRIQDTGMGISEQDLKNIFMPFFSTKKEGTGLGLSICYNIVKNHNGVIEVETLLNKGTTFIIRFPCV